MLKRVAAVLIDDYAAFEFGVLAEVFGIDRTEEGVPAIDFAVCSERPGTPVRCAAGGMATVTEYGLDALEQADLVGVPACRIRDEYPPAVLEALRAAHARGATLLSVCSGAFVLGETGLLDGRPCTTHWRHVGEFARRFPKARIDPDVLFVDDGRIITSAGTAAGIDACLHLVRRELGPQVATTIARRMVVPPQREGGQRQFIVQPIPLREADSLQPLLAWMVEHLEDEHPVAELARRAHMSERTFARRFVTETGTTPHRWLSQQRVLHAQQLLAQSDLPIEQIAQRAGFGTSAMLRHHFRNTLGVSPADYRRVFACE